MKTLKLVDAHPGITVVSYCHLDLDAVMMLEWLHLLLFILSMNIKHAQGLRWAKISCSQAISRLLINYICMVFQLSYRTITGLFKVIYLTRL